MEGDEPLAGGIKIWWDGNLVECNFRPKEAELPSHHTVQITLEA